MAAIAGLIIGLLGSMTRGSIVLASVPAFRLTARNLFLFVIGAFLGMFALVNVAERTLYVLGVFSKLPIGRQNELTYVLSFFGAVIGGTILVWLKIRRVTRT